MLPVLSLGEVMGTVTLYTFDDGEGQEDTFTTFNPKEAEDRARSQNLRCFANEYEYSDRDVAWDFSGKNRGYVCFAVCEQGYKVQVWEPEGGGPGSNMTMTEEYSAGNSSKDSQYYIPPSHLQAVSMQQLAEFAQNTAMEMASAKGISSDKVDYDQDLERELKEELGCSVGSSDAVCPASNEKSRRRPSRE